MTPGKRHAGTSRLRSRPARARAGPLAAPRAPAAEQTPRPRVAWRHDTASTALIAVAVIVAILERLWFSHAWRETATLTSVFYYGDATRFVEYARAIANGRLYDNGIPYHPPGWPLVLAGMLRWAGSTANAELPVANIKLVVALLSGASIGVAALLAGEVAGLGALIAVAVIGPFEFAHIVEGTVANSEALYGLAVTLASWVAWRWLRGEGAHGSSWAVAAALTAGAAMLVRAEGAAAAAIICAFAWRRRPRREVLVWGLTLAATLAPTTVWHWRTIAAFNRAHVGRVAGPLPRFAPITSYGAFNFAMANHEDADGGPNRDHPLLDRCQEATSETLDAGQLDLACPAIYDLYVHGYWIGARWILNNPGAAVALVGRKIAMTVGFLGHGLLADNIGVGPYGVRRRVDLVDPSTWWLVPIRLLLIVVGAIAIGGDSVAVAVLAAPLVALAGSVVMVYGYVRLGAAYLPLIDILIGAGLAASIRRLTGRRATQAAVIAATLGVLGGAVLEWARRDVPRSLVVDGPRSAAGAVIQDETVEITRPDR